MKRFPVTKVTIKQKPLPHHTPSSSVRLKFLEPPYRLYLKCPFYLKYALKTSVLGFGTLFSVYAVTWYYAGHYARAEQQANVDAIAMSHDEYKQIKIEEDRSSDYLESPKVKKIFQKY